MTGGPDPGHLCRAPDRRWLRRPGSERADGLVAHYAGGVFLPLLFPTTSAEGIRKKTPSGKCVVFFLPPPISHHVHAQASGKIASRKIVCSCERVRRFLPAIFFSVRHPRKRTPDTGLTSIRVAKLGKRLPRGPPPRNRSSMLRSAYPPRGAPSISLIPPR